MQVGNLVTFNKVPGVNTPGAPSSAQPGVGTVVRGEYPQGVVFQGNMWCDVLWPSGEVTKCYKKDLNVIERTK